METCKGSKMSSSSSLCHISYTSFCSLKNRCAPVLFFFGCSPVLWDTCARSTAPYSTGFFLSSPPPLPPRGPSFITGEPHPHSECPGARPQSARSWAFRTSRETRKELIWGERWKVGPSAREERPPGNHWRTFSPWRGAELGWSLRKESQQVSKFLLYCWLLEFLQRINT